jgi:GntR family transcriptional repressor for pyruvate dehydrogenase complex
MSRAVEKKEPPSSYDLKFHKLVARAAGNPILEMLADAMLEVASKVITELHPSLDVLKNVVKRHREVFEAIKSKDGELAFTLMSEHIVDVQKRLSKRPGGNGWKTRPHSKKRR